MAANRSLELLYVGDPMCSWCWGMAPVLEQLEDRHEVPLRVMVGGLRPGPAAQALTPAMKSYLAHHWLRVEQISGQPFNHDLFEWEGWVYDTELAAVAVVTMRTLNEKQTLPFFTRLQRAFYVDNVDVTSPDVYPALLAEFAVDGSRFMELLGSEEMRQRAWEDFRAARELGVMGFPTLLLRDGDMHDPIASGYSPTEHLDEVLRGTLERRRA